VLRRSDDAIPCDVPATKPPWGERTAATRKRIEELERAVSELGTMMNVLAAQLEAHGYELKLELQSPLLAPKRPTPPVPPEPQAEPAGPQRPETEETAGTPDPAAPDPAEAAILAWLRAGEVVSTHELAKAWSSTPQVIGSATGRGELVALKVKSDRYYPHEFLALDQADVVEVCKELQGLRPFEQFLFWKRDLPTMMGAPVSEALPRRERIPGRLATVVQLAKAYKAARRDAARAAR
jgi:hypothetical protein